jgi:hypothetical protein
VAMDMDMNMDMDMDTDMYTDVDMDRDTVNQNNHFIASKLRVLMYDRFIA